ncbi:MAG: sigma-70 family RNA polymerase sigma factor [Archangium sp.]
MSREDLEREVKARWPSASPSPQLLSTAASPLLVLTRAAMAGEPWALDVLEREVFVVARDRLALRYDRARADEALQYVREQLLVSRPGLDAYQGRGSLLSWVMVIAARRVLALSTPAETELDEDLPIEDVDVDVALIRARYASTFKRALSRAIASLERRQRLVLRMHVVDGLSAEKIAAVFHVHRATVTSWISSARDDIKTRVAQFVREEAGIGANEFDSIVHVVQQFTDLSLPRLLAVKEQP